MARLTLPLRKPKIVPVVALSLSKGFRGRPSSATILHPEVNIGKSLNIFKSPPVDFVRLSLGVFRNKDSIAEFSIWKNGLECTGGMIGFSFKIGGGRSRKLLGFGGDGSQEVGVDRYREGSV